MLRIPSLVSPSANVALRPYRVFITDLSYGHSLFFIKIFNVTSLMAKITQRHLWQNIPYVPFLLAGKLKHPKELTIQRMYVIMNIYESGKGVKT